MESINFSLRVSKCVCLIVCVCMCVCVYWCVCVCVREKERNSVYVWVIDGVCLRETEIKKETQTDRQDRQDRQTDRLTFLLQLLSNSLFPCYRRIGTFLSFNKFSHILYKTN